MIDLVVQADKVLGPERWLAPGWVLARAGRIVDVGEGRAPEVAGAAREEWPGVLAPGFVDLHIHGSGNYLIEEGREALEGLSRLLPRWGVTGFLPTVIPRDRAWNEGALPALAAAEFAGARCLAFFLEGPYLTRAGAAIRLAKEADAGALRELMAMVEPHVAVSAIAPDFAGMERLLPVMTAQGQPAFITHTAARVDETRRAIDLGARHCSHFYDVFYPPAEDEPGRRPCGVVEVALADPRVTVDFILDMEHVEPAAVELALACKGPGGVCLITDANVGAGNPPGVYPAFGNYIEFAYPGAPARFTKDHPTLAGGLAGSGLTLDQAVRNAVGRLGIPFDSALRMASENPARVIGRLGEIGRLAAGAQADMVLLDDDLVPARTWVGGRCVFDAERKGIVT